MQLFWIWSFRMLKQINKQTNKTIYTNKKIPTDGYTLRSWQNTKEQFLGKDPVVEYVKGKIV